MRSQHELGSALLIALIALGIGCGGTMNTGTAKKPVNNKPAADGTCPVGESICGTAAFAICVDLQNDPEHCGTCDRACSPGIACQAGVCQQTVCTGTSVPVSGKPTTVTDGGATPDPYFPRPSLMANQILADVNGDGRLDLVEGSYLAGSYPRGACIDCGVDAAEFRVSLGQANGTFASPDTYHANAAIDRFFATDVNSDGMADLYIVSSNGSDSVTAPYHVELWLGQKDGHLRRADAAGANVEGMANWGYEIAVSDLSGDGWPDLVMEAADPDLEVPPKISVYLSDSTGALHWSQTFPAWAGRTFVRDMNGDGSPDLVLMLGAMQILYNRGNGTFEPPLNCGLSVGIGAWGEGDILMEDFNRDGWVDLAAGEGKNHVAVLLGLGQCGFAPVHTYDVPGTDLGLLVAADMNGDGFLDLVSVSAVVPRDATGVYIAGKTDNLLGVLLGASDGTFHLADPAISLGPGVVSSVAIGEVTGDGRPDVIVSSAGSSTTQTGVWENVCQ